MTSRPQQGGRGGSGQVPPMMPIARRRRSARGDAGGEAGAAVAAVASVVTRSPPPLRPKPPAWLSCALTGSFLLPRRSWSSSAPPGPSGHARAASASRYLGAQTNGHRETGRSDARRRRGAMPDPERATADRTPRCPRYDPNSGEYAPIASSTSAATTHSQVHRQVLGLPVGLGRVDNHLPHRSRAGHHDGPGLVRGSSRRDRQTW